MLNRLIFILLWLSMISSDFSRVFAYVGFEANQKYIAETLCVNKSRPWMHCNGKCYLMKKMKQAEENEKKQADKDNMIRLSLSFFQEPSLISLQAPVTLDTAGHSFPGYTYQYSSQHIDAIFKPPRSIV